MRKGLKFALLLGVVMATGATAAIAAMNNPPPRSARADDRFDEAASNRGVSHFFADYDLNHDGKVTRSEVGTVVAQRFKAAAGGAKLVTAQQYEADGLRRHRDRVKQAFKRADWNGDGVLTADEFASQQRARFLAVDKEGGGVIDCARRSAPSLDNPNHRRGGSGRGICPDNDLNQDGKVTRAEFDKAAAQRFAQETHGGRAVTFDQFVAGGNTRGAGSNASRFDRLDNDGNGTLSLAEYSVPQQRMFARIDVNHDGIITRDELANAPRGGNRSGGF
jgi:Ca2+-binding EF-hand superfamily protein